MPVYEYEHPVTKKVKSLVQRMNEPHEYIDSKGVKWDRILSIPNMATGDTATLNDISPFDQQAFNKKVGKMKKVTQGDLWDMSAELSAKRAQKRNGVDPVKQKAVDAYAKKTGGKKHPLI